jgi:hypothetical protein
MNLIKIKDQRLGLVYKSQQTKSADDFIIEFLSCVFNLINFIGDDDYELISWRSNFY